MEAYITEKDAIIGLHEKGFTEDFQIHGNDLLWVREKIIVRAGEFSIVECHSICSTEKRNLIFGICLSSGNIRGIVIKRSGHSMNKIPSVIRKKLNELIEHLGVDSDSGPIKTHLWMNLSGHLRIMKAIRNLRFWSDELLWYHLN